MTDSDSDPLDPRDELASAALDGDTALDDGTQELADRIARLAQVRDQVAAPVAFPSDDVRDQMIARAISVGVAAADAGASSPEATGAGAASVTSLDAHRSRRTARLRRLAPIAAAAAVLLLVAIVTPALLDSGGDDLASTAAERTTGADTAAGEMADAAAREPTESSSDQALAPDDADTAADTAGVAMEEGVAGAEAAADPEAGAVLVVPAPLAPEIESEFPLDEFGAEVSDEELLDAVIQYRSRQSANSLRSSVEGVACAGVVDHSIDLVATGSYRGQPADFFAQVDGSAVLAVTVVDPACEVLATVTSE